MKKYISFTAAFFALFTIMVAQEMPNVSNKVENLPAPAGDLIKILAPIVAGLIAKLIDRFFDKKNEKK